MHAGGDEVQLVVFRVGSQEFALEISQVERILRWRKPAPLPGAPAFLEGLLSHEDGVVPVVDLRKRLSVEAPTGDETRLIILALDGQRVAGAVDAVVEVLRADAAAIAPPPPIVRGLAAKYLTGVLARGDRTIVLLNPAKLFSGKERLALEQAADGATGA
jgi:purine-binding chemotaxis protein CheW